LRLLRVRPRRSREGRTDYRLRLELVKSGRPRLVVRRTNRYIIVQLVESRRGGDYTALTVTTKSLRRYGWMGGTKCLPAAYLAGLLAGRIALKKGYVGAIADIGLHTAHPGSRIFAAIKGAIDAGLTVPASEGALPSEERLRGTHITRYFESMGGDGLYPQFSTLDPAALKDLPSHFAEVKRRILGELEAT